MREWSPAVAHPAATVVLLRDGEDGGEVLLVRRNERLAFHGGAWVFPGGRIDPEDFARAPASTDIVGAAREAAVREAREEAGVLITPESLRVFARWVTPEQLPKRFDAWFFVGRAGTDAVRVDGREIHAHCYRHADPYTHRDAHFNHYSYRNRLAHTRRTVRLRGRGR